MLNITATIGRNVRPSHPTRGNLPLTESDWTRFQDAVRHGLDVLDPDWVESHQGAGEWDGVVEESVKIAAYGVDLTRLEYLKAHLADVCREWHQDAIALNVGMSELIEAP